MKKAALVTMFLLTSQTVQAFECNECHSKNPAMVRMHKAVQGRDCFGCHKIGEKLMGKGVPRDKAPQVKRRESDPLCAECHQKQIRQPLKSGKVTTPRS
jgi:polyferredoxin